MGKLLPTVIQLADERLHLLVHDLVSPHISPLSEALAAYVALVGSLARMTAFMSLYRRQESRSASWICRPDEKRYTNLEITQLREPLAAGRFLADLQWKTSSAVGKSNRGGGAAMNDRRNPLLRMVSYKWFDTRVCSHVNFQMRLLAELLATSRLITFITFLPLSIPV